jgi:hypothetical protein
VIFGKNIVLFVKSSVFSQKPYVMTFFDFFPPLFSNFLNFIFGFFCTELSPIFCFQFVLNISPNFFSWMLIIIYYRRTLLQNYPWFLRFVKQIMLKNALENCIFICWKVLKKSLNCFPR